jgi:hypothetical protein
MSLRAEQGRDLETEQDFLSFAKIKSIHGIHK